MTSENLLRRQVSVEIRRRRIIFFTLMVLSFLYLSISLVFGDMGLVRYFELRRTKKNLERQVADISRQNEQIREKIRLLREDPFYKEKFAREEFGMARPDEYIFQYDK